MDEFMNDLPFWTFIGVVAFIIIVGIISLCVCFINIIWGYEFEAYMIECIVTHMDVDDGRFYVTVVGKDGVFSNTISVSSDEYAKYNVGDCCIVVISGEHLPIGDDVFKYSLG